MSDFIHYKGVQLSFPDGWQGVVVSAIVYAAIAWVFIFSVRFIFVAPYLLRKGTQDTNADLRNDLANSKAELEKRPLPKMIGRVEQFSEGDNSGVLACMFNITIKNQGSPSIVDNWAVDLIHSTGAHLHGQIQAIQKANILMDDGTAQIFTSADFIYDKGVKGPIPQGGMVRGWLAVQFPGMTRDNVPSDCYYEIYFTDIFELNHVITAKKQALQI